jgi:N-acyl homoserine lactone hydrolase
MRLTLLCALLTLGGCAALAPAPDHPFVAAPTEALPKLEVCWLETAGTEGPAGFASAGWSTSPSWEATSSAILVRHPKGDLLIDTGSSPDFKAELTELKAFDRFVLANNAGRMEPRGQLPELIREAGADPAKLKYIVLSHVHPDHAGGVSTLPGVPVLLAPEEIYFVEQMVNAGRQALVPAQGRALTGRMTPLVFEPAPYENFDESFDVFGDGAVVITKLFGHTPGSVGTFINLSPGRRLIHVGDVINSEESLERNVPKSRLMTALTDVDSERTHREAARLVQLHRLDPKLTILPAHDRRVWEAFFGSKEKSSAKPKCVSN